jgi:hypothetical protein
MYPITSAMVNVTASSCLVVAGVASELIFPLDRTLSLLRSRLLLALLLAPLLALLLGVLFYYRHFFSFPEGIFPKS